MNHVFLVVSVANINKHVGKTDLEMLLFLRNKGYLLQTGRLVVNKIDGF
jgi:hypothetical protein